MTTADVYYPDSPNCTVQLSTAIPSAHETPTRYIPTWPREFRGRDKLTLKTWLDRLPVFICGSSPARSEERLIEFDVAQAEFELWASESVPQTGLSGSQPGQSLTGILNVLG